MKIHIKYMVSKRCKMVVQEELYRLGLHCGPVDLGKAEVREDLTPAQRERLGRALLKSGLELLDDKKAILVEKIKTAIVQMIHYTDQPIKIKNSDYLSQQLNHEYAYLATLFSETTGLTIEHYVIAQKIELIKELLLYDELSISEIASQLNYSSVAHLSAQFKRLTGLTPTYFKQLKQYKRRLALEDVGIV